MRLQNLRILNGMTQTEFAAELGIKQAQVSQIEKGRSALTPTHIATARIRFGLPLGFFEAEPIRYGPGDLNYRTRKLSAKEQGVANMAFGLTEQACRARMGSSENHTPSLELVRGDEQLAQPDIEAASVATREFIGIPRDKVVNNVTRCVEHLGVLVAPLDAPRLDGKVDGISTPAHDSRPFVMTLDLSKPGDRIRFSCAHELGHLLLHTDYRPVSSEVRESEAHAFASAFLLPEQPMREELSPTLTLAGYAQVKSRWGVSIQSIIRRARDLDIIDHHRYRSLFIQLSSRGWRGDEPVAIPRETPAIQQTQTGAPMGRAENKQLADVINLFGPYRKAADG